MLRVTQPARGVQTRTERETDVRGARARRLDLRHIHESGEPGVPGVAKPLQTERREDPVLGSERDDVGDGPDRDEVEVLLDGVGKFAVVAGERLEHLEGDADAGEILVRIARVLPLRVDDRERVGKRLLGLVVIGHDDVESHLTAKRDLLVPGDAAVDGDDELGPDVARELHAAVGEPVSFIETVRDVEVDAATDGLETSLHQHDGGDAIDVVVAADEDPLAVVDRAAESLERRIDIREEEGIAELGAVGPEERIGIRTRHNAASGEYGGEGRVHLSSSASTTARAETSLSGSIHRFRTNTCIPLVPSHSEIAAAERP